MEIDITKPIETAASTNNEEEKFHAGCRDGGPVIIRFKYPSVLVQQQQQPKPKWTYYKPKRKSTIGW